MTQYGFLAMPGLGYKYFTKSGAFRVMVGGIIDSRTDSWAGGSSSYGQNAINVHAGYQYHVMLGRFMPILGVDAHAGNYESFNNYDNGYNKESSLTIGISPNLGLEFWISPKLSFLMDTRFNLSYVDQAYENEWFDPWSGGSEVSKTRTQGIQTHVSPISSFMAAFHF